jgi:hypothetical protein
VSDGEQSVAHRVFTVSPLIDLIDFKQAKISPVFSPRLTEITPHSGFVNNDSILHRTARRDYKETKGNGEGT